MARLGEILNSGVRQPPSHIPNNIIFCLSFYSRAVLFFLCHVMKNIHQDDVDDNEVMIKTAESNQSSVH